jgi:hypothetical protein
MHKTIVTGIAAAGIILAALAYVNKGSVHVSGDAARTEKFTGYVTDLKCKRSVDKDCNRQCLSAGEQPALLLDGSKEVLRLKNAESVKKYPAARVEIWGTRSDDVITVAAVRAL